MKDAELRAWMDFFEGIGAVYCRTMLDPPWRKYGECVEPWQAIAFFLEGYAFERQGRNPGYAPAAVDAVTECKGLLAGSIDENVEREIWENYKVRLHNKNLNSKLCPLNPVGSAEHGSILARLRAARNLNLLAHTTALLQRDARSAHNFMWSIRGSGPKIASFFLRDAKELYSITAIEPTLRYLLQPIDVWVWRTVNILQGPQEVPSLSDAGDTERKDAAQFIVDSSCNPERVNMGMWYFAAMVCQSEYRHGERLRGVESARKAWGEYVREREEEVGKLRN